MHTADPLRLHWVKHGGEVYRQGLIPADTLLLTAHLTASTARLAPPLQPNSKWQLPRRGHATKSGVGRQAASLWARTSAALLSVFRRSQGRSGNQLRGVQVWPLSCCFGFSQVYFDVFKCCSLLLCLVRVCL